MKKLIFALLALTLTTSPVLAGSLTSNRLIRYDAAQKTVDSIIYDNGTTVGVGTLSPRGKLDIDGAIYAPEIRVDNSIYSDGNLIIKGDPYAKKDWYLKIPTPSDLTPGGTATNDQEVWRMVEFNGDLYIAYYTAYAPEQAKIYRWDGKNLTLFKSFGTGVHFFNVDIAVYKDKLYAGVTGQSAGDADIYEYDPLTATWTKTFEDTTHYGVFQFKTFNGNLYAGFADWGGTAYGDIYAFDGSTWTLSYDAPSGRNLIESMEEHNGKLYAGGGSAAGSAFVVVFNGSTWSDVSSFGATTYKSVINLVSYHGSLYASVQENVITGPEIIRYDSGTSWTEIKDDDIYPFCHALAVYNDKLYTGCTNLSGLGSVWVWDESAGISGWTKVHEGTGTEKEAFRLYVYNGELLIGYGYDWQAAGIYAYRKQLGEQYSKTYRDFLKYVSPSNGYDHSQLNIGYGTTNATNNLIVGTNTSIGTSTADRRLRIKATTTASSTDNFIYATDSSLNPVLSVTTFSAPNTAGAVGIGTSKPDQPLDVRGNVKIDGSSLPALTFGSDFKLFMVPSAQTNPSLSIWANTTEKITVSATSGISTLFKNGNVGINVTAPKSKLQVDGSIYAGTTIPTRSGINLANSGNGMFGGSVEVDGAVYVDGYLYGNGLPGINGSTCSQFTRGICTAP